MSCQVWLENKCGLGFSGILFEWILVKIHVPVRRTVIIIPPRGGCLRAGYNNWRRER